MMRERSDILSGKREQAIRGAGLGDILAVDGKLKEEGDWACQGQERS